jgi:hypothetical protein
VTEQQDSMIDRLGAMETISEAVDRLAKRGFRETFQADEDGSLRVAEVVYAPEVLIVEEVVRFEGASDPQDEAVLFALRSPDGQTAGTLITTYGPQAEPALVEATRRLQAPRPRS